MVLLVVDTQKLITTPDLYNFNAFECAVKSLIAAARENNVEVIYVRHDDGAGAELTKGTPGFEIYEGFGPQPSEKISKSRRKRKPCIVILSWTKPITRT